MNPHFYKLETLCPTDFLKLFPIKACPNKLAMLVGVSVLVKVKQPRMWMKKFKNVINTQKNDVWICDTDLAMMDWALLVPPLLHPIHPTT